MEVLPTCWSPSRTILNLILPPTVEDDRLIVVFIFVLLYHLREYNGVRITGGPKCLSLHLFLLLLLLFADELLSILAAFYFALRGNISSISIDGDRLEIRLSNCWIFSLREGSLPLAPLWNSFSILALVLDLRKLWLLCLLALFSMTLALHFQILPSQLWL